MTPEDVILVNIRGLNALIQQNYSESVVNEFISNHMRLWHEKAWPHIQNWLLDLDEQLLHHPSTRNLVIHSFAQTLPEYSHVKNYLDSLLLLYEPFWNQFFINLLKAKLLLAQSKT